MPKRLCRTAGCTHRRQKAKGRARRNSFPGSAWERNAKAALPHRRLYPASAESKRNAAAQLVPRFCLGTQCQSGSAALPAVPQRQQKAKGTPRRNSFPGSAWERNGKAALPHRRLYPSVGRKQKEGHGATRSQALPGNAMPKRLCRTAGCTQRRQKAKGTPRRSSFPGSAWERNGKAALTHRRLYPASAESKRNAAAQLVPRLCLGTQCQSGSAAPAARQHWREHETEGTAAELEQRWHSNWQ